MVGTEWCFVSGGYSVHYKFVKSMFILYIIDINNTLLTWYNQASKYCRFSPVSKLFHDECYSSIAQFLEHFCRLFESRTWLIIFLPLKHFLSIIKNLIFFTNLTRKVKDIFMPFFLSLSWVGLMSLNQKTISTWLFLPLSAWFPVCSVMKKKHFFKNTEKRKWKEKSRLLECSELTNFIIAFQIYFSTGSIIMIMYR